MLALPNAHAALSANARSATKSLRVLILGGTGFIGPHFVRTAINRGHRVSVFNRGKSIADLPPEAERLIGDRNSDLESIKNRDWDAVLDLSTFVPGWVRRLGEAIRGRVKHYLFISTVAAYRQPGSHQTLYEDSPLQAYEGQEDPYSLNGLNDSRNHGGLKVLCEQEANAQFSDATLILRPGYILGANDPNGVVPYWLLRLSKDGEVMAVGDELLPVQFIDVRDLAEWGIRLVEQGTTGVYNTVGPAVPTALGQLLDAASRTVSKVPKVTWVSSAWLASRADRETWHKLFFFSQEPEGYGWMMLMNNQRALTRGLSLRPVSDTLAYLFDAYRKLPEDDQAKLLTVYKKNENASGFDIEPMSWPTYLDLERAMLLDWHKRAQR